MTTISSALLCARPAIGAALASLTLWGAACSGDGTRTADDALDAPARGALVDHPVESGALAPFLPESFAGYDRAVVRPISDEFEGDVSNGVETEYGLGSGSIFPPVRITIWDHGSSEYWLRTLSLLNYEMENRTGGELERITKFRGYPTAETERHWNDEPEAGMQIVVAGRFFVELQTRGVTLDQLREAAAALDLEGLAAVKGS